MNIQIGTPHKTEEDRIKQHDVPGRKAWAQSIYERDNYTCQISGKRGGITLNAHHLEAWVNNPELRLDKNNGITLWQPIHKLFHSEYGRGYNTNAQFKEFKIRYENKEFDKKYYT